jgi:crotonobetainyl-CoA:carnitine CoA-transferase CaiB-like acyl-CoA transferase
MSTSANGESPMSATDQATGPLTGLRVIDLTHVLNGPFATMLLAHMGADVVKIEHGKGDRFRHAWMAVDADHDGYEFLVVNTNKRGITLNLKHDKGKELFRELVKNADVVVENFSIGVMDRLGLSYERLREVNPRIIYASSRGYGEDGPSAHLRANAATIMAATGWTNAGWDFAGKQGTIPQGIGDEAAGVSLAVGILAALYGRAQTGVGQRIEVSMQEALLGFMVSNFHTLFEKRRVGALPKQCADGYVAFHLPDMSQELWKAFATALGHPEAIADPRFETVQSRREHYAEWDEMVATWVRSSTRAELAQVFRDTGISAAPVKSLAEVVEDEHLHERRAFVEVEDAKAGTVTMLRPWIRFSDTPAAIRTSAPQVGQHNDEVYRELLGLGEAELAELRAEGVI